MRCGLRHRRVPSNVRFYAGHLQICHYLRNSCIQCVGAQFLRPIEIAILDGDNRILDFNVDAGTMDYSLVKQYFAADVLLAVEHVVVVVRPLAGGAGFRGEFEGEHGRRDGRVRKLKLCMSLIGTFRRFVATQQNSRFRVESGRG